MKAVVLEFPDTSLDFLDRSFSKEALPGWALVLTTSAITYHYDPDLLDGTQRTGRRWGLSNEDHTRTVWRLGEFDIVRLPSDTASALYFLGDGWLDVLATGGFLAFGYFGDHDRPYNTAMQLAHGLLVSAVFDQVLKRSTGRESPSDRSEPRGKWRPFPSARAYGENTAKYDAMPSGHMMTSTLMFTIIRANYPEYDAYLLPLELTWLTVLGFAMINNAVHWASDYPLGIAMGYMIGKASTRLGTDRKDTDKTASNWLFVPGQDPYGTVTVNAVRFY